MEQGNPLCGGVSLCHSLDDEKHCYKVENALTHYSSTFRKGDIIAKINNKKTQDLPPEEFIRMLNSESSILTIHKASIDMEEGQCPESDSIHAFREEKTTLNFRLVMVREECLKAEEDNEMELEWESDDIEDEEDLVLVSMTETNVAVVEMWDCDSENPCNNVGINECNVSNVVVKAKKSELIPVCSQSVRRGENDKVNYLMTSLIMSHVHSHTHVPFSEDVTIYHYITNISGVSKTERPVVLKRTDSDHFLKCTRDVHKGVILTTEYYEKEKMMKICKDDPNTWPFVFYMKTESVNNRLFESAAHRGWFIHTVEPGVSLWVGEKTVQTNENFCFLLKVQS